MPQTRIRFKQSCTIATPSIGTDGRPTLGAATTVSCALWRRRFHDFVPQQGEAKRIDALAFVPRGTSVALRDRVVEDGIGYEVVNLTTAHDDRNRVDHIGLQLQLVSG